MRRAGRRGPRKRMMVSLTETTQHWGCLSDGGRMGSAQFISTSISRKLQLLQQHSSATSKEVLFRRSRFWNQRREGSTATSTSSLRDLYVILGISAEASDSEIKSAFYKVVSCIILLLYCCNQLTSTLIKRKHKNIIQIKEGIQHCFYK